MGIIEGWAISTVAAWAGGIAATWIIGWIITKIPFAKFAKWAEKIGKDQGVAITTFAQAKLPKFWNSVLEPVFIDTIDALFLSWIRGLMIGLRSDNK